MPKIVDHDERRAQVAEAVLAVVDRGGLAGLTMKSVAAEAGWSTGVINHYFDSKAELLTAAAQHALDIRTAQTDAGAALEEPVDAIFAVIEAQLPLDGRAMVLSRVMVAFLAEAMAVQTLGDYLRAFQVSWRETLQTVIERGMEAGAFDPKLDVSSATETLAAFTYGISVQSAFEAIPAGTQRELVRQWIDSTLGHPADEN